MDKIEHLMHRQPLLSEEQSEIEISDLPAISDPSSQRLSWVARKMLAWQRYRQRRLFNVFFIATLYGIPFGPTQLALAAGYSALFNATIPGIPGGGMIAITPMLLALGLPLEGLAIVIAVNPIVDRFTTIGNVAANMAVTAILARRSKGINEADQDAF